MTRCFSRFRLVILVVATVATFSLAPALAGGVRIVVDVDEPFVVDGTVYPAGSLSVRILRAFTPSSNVNEVWVGTERLGMMVTRRGDAAPGGDLDAMVFERDAEGRLVLVGYTLRGEDAPQLLRRERAGDARLATAAKPEAVLIASR